MRDLCGPFLLFLPLLSLSLPRLSARRQKKRARTFPAPPAARRSLVDIMDMPSLWCCAEDPDQADAAPPAPAPEPAPASKADDVPDDLFDEEE